MKRGSTRRVDPNGTKCVSYSMALGEDILVHIMTAFTAKSERIPSRQGESSCSPNGTMEILDD